MDINRLLKQCRFSSRYRGYLMLAECLTVILANEKKIMRMTEVYAEVGEKFGISWNGVERNIRTALNYAWENGGQAELEKLFGGVFYTMPSAGELIELLTEYLKDHTSEQN